jgi:ABC-2 type transport system permease protein
VKGFRDYLELVRFQLLTNRNDIWFMGMIQVAFSVGFVLGFGYIIPDITKDTALFITIGSATQSIIMVALVGTPQMLAMAKAEGRLDYFMTLPISREAYLLAIATQIALVTLPGIIFAVVLGWLRYDLTLSIDVAVVAVVPLAMLSLAGAGIAMAILVPHQQLTNALTQLLIFYVIFFAPVLLPKEQLPEFLQFTAKLLPPSYAADGMRATLTDLPGTQLGQSLAAMAGFSALSLGAASLAVRRRR